MVPLDGPSHAMGTGARARCHRSRRSPPIALAAVAIAVGIFTRFVTRSSLWLDEALSVIIASAPLGQLFEHLKHDGHPPFYYLLLHLVSLVQSHKCLKQC